MILPTLGEADGGVSIMASVAPCFADVVEDRGYAMIRQCVRIDARRRVILAGVVPCREPSHGIGVDHGHGAAVTHHSLDSKVRDERSLGRSTFLGGHYDDIQCLCPSNSHGAYTAR